MSVKVCNVRNMGVYIDNGKGKGRYFRNAVLSVNNEIMECV